MGGLAKKKYKKYKKCIKVRIENKKYKYKE